MPPDPKTVKLRAGAAAPKNVKLYSWTSSGSLAITEVEQGEGLDQVYVHKSVIFSESGTGSDSVDKSLNILKSISDDGAGIESLIVARTRLESGQVESELDVFIGRIRDLKRVQGILRVYSTIIDEGRLSISGDIDRLVNAYVYPVGEVNNLRAVETAEDHPIAARLTSNQKTPKGYHQGHKSYTVRLYTLGRHSIFDNLLVEDGDSHTFECIDIRCLDKDGRQANIFVENGSIVSADPVIQDRIEVVYCYTAKCGKFCLKPNIGVLRMTIKPVSAPMTVNLTHPVIHELESGIEALLGKEEVELSLLSTDYASEGSAHRGTLIIESDYEATLV